MKDWAHEVRLLANESAHPEAPVPADLDPQDVREVVNFRDFLLLYPYDLPKQIENYRKAKRPGNPLGLHCCVRADVTRFSDSDCHPFCDSASISASRPPHRYDVAKPARL